MTTDPHAPGAKLDEGKPLAGLVLGPHARYISPLKGHLTNRALALYFEGSSWQNIARTMSPEDLAAVVDVGTFGAEKYTPGGWREVPFALARYHDAFMRHVLRMMMGEAVDPESGLAHEAHALWNALACAYFDAAERPAHFAHLAPREEVSE